MTGGRVTINSQADGIDSNGSVNLMGGYASIASASMGGEAGIDYDGQLYVADDFQLNNQSGVAGPDGMPGDMNGGMNGPMGGLMNGNEPFGGQNAFGPGQNGQQPPQPSQMNQ